MERKIRHLKGVNESENKKMKKLITKEEYRRIGGNERTTEYVWHSKNIRRHQRTKEKDKFNKTEMITVELSPPLCQAERRRLLALNKPVALCYKYFQMTFIDRVQKFMSSHPESIIETLRIWVRVSSVG